MCAGHNTNLKLEVVVLLFSVRVVAVQNVLVVHLELLMGLSHCFPVRLLAPIVTIFSEETNLLSVKKKNTAT